MQKPSYRLARLGPSVPLFKKSLQFAFWLEIPYYPNLCLIKLSILIFYGTIFRAYRRVVQALLRSRCDPHTWQRHGHHRHLPVQAFRLLEPRARL